MKCFKCHQNLDSEKTTILYGLHANCFVEWFGSNYFEFTGLDPKPYAEQGNLPVISVKNDTFFHGRYKKYSANLGSVKYILKMQQDGLAELPATEYLCNQIAELLGIEIAPYYLINFQGAVTFVTRNFIQDHTCTLNHLYKYLPEGQENYNCEQIINVILSQTKRLADIEKFMKICLYDALIGNNDRHGRNLGLIETKKQIRLAPMYDNPSYIAIEDDFLLESTFNPSGSIWTSKSQEPKALDYIEEFHRLGYQKLVEKFSDKITSLSIEIIELINNSHLTPKRKKAFIKLVADRIGDFKHA